jgi:hypothetical protein
MKELAVAVDFGSQATDNLLDKILATLAKWNKKDGETDAVSYMLSAHSRLPL